MKLSTQDADIFFELMWALQFFVNQRLQLLPEVTTVEQYQNCPTAEKMEVRQALYDNIGLIDDFVQENPQQFSDEKLTIIKKWKQFVSGDFYIERLLKKYSIFIGSDDKVYGVIGLYDDLNEMFEKSHLPILVKAVLLPFKDSIVYDGLLQGYSVYFGGNIRAGLKDVYLRAKHDGEIIDSFEISDEKAKDKKPAKSTTDWTPVLEELIAQAKQLRGGSGQPRVNSPAFSLVRASLQLAQSAVSDPHNQNKLFKQVEKVYRAIGNVENEIYRM